MTGASFSNFMSLRVSYQLRYSLRSSYMLGAVGCQMPTSGNVTGSETFAISTSWSAGVYACAIVQRKLSRLSVLPPSQYCRLSMKLRASCALSDGRYLRTLGSVRTSLSMPSSKPPPLFCFLDFMNSAMALLLCPSCDMLKLPSLLRRMTAGMEGKMTHASSSSRRGCTTSITLSASSSTKMSEPMKTLASPTSFLKLSKLSGSRSSSSRYPTTSTASSGRVSLICLTAAESELWYCASRTTYTTLTRGRPLTLSGMTRRTSWFVDV
mmetsp:Transcript_295/g.866  ORF Transcript_295/g.866 Transcript_295/m.866 type:complete len:267 (-) Transcript_295:169-969(-)